MFFGSADRVYARPSAGLPGQTSIAANYLLSQPEGLLTPRSGKPVALRPLTPLGGTPARTPVDRVDGTYRIVDAGSAGALRTSSVRGAVALVAGSCADLTDAATTLRKAGASAMVAYAAPGQTCPGTLEPGVGLPALQAGPLAVPGLLATAGGSAKLATERSPSYMYDLVRFWDQSVPDGGTVDGTGKSVSALVEHYNGLGSTSADGMEAVEELIGWVPERGGVANIGLVRGVPFPTTVTHYVSTGAVWERTVAILDSEFGGEYGRLYAPRRTYAGGSTTHDSWFGGPIGSRVSPLSTVANGNPPPTREGDELFVTVGSYTDAAGHLANSDIFSNEFSGQIYVDDELELDMFASVFMNTTIPAGDHRIRVVAETQRENRFWQRSTDVRTEWAFDSETPDGPFAVLPMLGVDYRMALSDTNTAKAGPYEFDVHFAMPDTVPTRTVADRSFEISWDGGQTWKSPDRVRCQPTSCTVRVRNQPGASASLRVSATDVAGRSVSQKIIDAYDVARRP